MNIFQLFRRNLGEVTQYLHLAVRLFIAVSSSYDPLIQNISSDQALSSTESDKAIFNNRCKVAQIAVGQGEWGSKGINSSAEYLKQLFELREGMSWSRLFDSTRSCDSPRSLNFSEYQ
jgi:hypothetical protein